MKIFKILDGRRPPFLKLFFGHNSTANCSISVKFAQGSRIPWR